MPSPWHIDVSARFPRPDDIVTTLVIAPDFLSHYQPMAAIADALRRSGERVIIATGNAMQPFVARDGFEWRRLDLAAGSNDGVASAIAHDRGDPSSLERFIAATRQGFVATLAFQAAKRSHELLWNPIEVGRAIRTLLEDAEPEHVLVDQVSLVSTLGLLASGRPFTTVVPGHPTQLPVGDEQYGSATTWPQALRPDADELDALARQVERINADVTDAFNGALAQLAPSAAPVDHAFAAHGELVAFHWESDLHDPVRRARLPEHVDLGPLVRQEELPDDYAAVVAGDRPLVVVALGTFLVHRHDVLASAIRAVELAGARAVVAIGDHDPESLGPVPDDWVLARRIPQVALLRHADCIISHGGNGSVQEALAAGVGQVLLPMSTDQMAIAADLERADRAVAADPNRLDVDDLADRLSAVIEHGAWSRTPSSVGELVSRRR